MKPFLYAVADKFGAPVFDEGCVASDPDLLSGWDERVEDGHHKIVPCYTGPQIEMIRERAEKAEAEIAALKADRANANHLLENMREQIAALRDERDTLKARRVKLPNAIEVSNFCQRCIPEENMRIALRVAGVEVEGV